MKNIKGQEEMVGFVLIVIVVAVILLFFLTLYAHKKTPQVESQKAEKFITSMLQYTTNCKSGNNYLDVQDLMFQCINNPESECDNGAQRNTCNVLNSTLDGIVKVGWPVGPDVPIKGYELNVSSNAGEIVYLSAGNKTSLEEGSLQNFARGSGHIDVIFRYYS